MDETRCDTIREEFAATLRTEKGRVVSRRGYRKCALLPVEYRAPERRSITRAKPTPVCESFINPHSDLGGIISLRISDVITLRTD